MNRAIAVDLGCVDGHGCTDNEGIDSNKGPIEYIFTIRMEKENRYEIAEKRSIYKGEKRNKKLG